MYLFFLILLLLFFVIISVVDARKTKKLLEVPITEKVRIKWYNDAIIWGWIPVFAVLIICFTTEINFADIGLKLIDFNYTNLFSIFILVLCGVIFVLCLYQVISYVTSSEYREEIKKKLADNKDKNQYGAVMDLLIPRSKKEKGLFFVVALTAGISEEMLLRGFLYFLIIAAFPEISIVIVVLIGSLLFGMCHLYQGFQGVVKTSLVGALFGCLFLVTDSLIPGILLHFFLDFSSAFLLSEEETA